MRRIAGMVVVVVAVLSACSKDKAAEVPVAQQSTAAAPLPNTAPPPATKTAPAPATRTAPSSDTKTAGPAERPASSPADQQRAAAELANARRVRTVQVAALPTAASAEWWAGELRKNGIPAYTTSAIVDYNEVTRLRIGAAVTDDEARALAAKIHAEYKWPVWITTVEDKSILPADALFLTRNYIR